MMRRRPSLLLSVVTLACLLAPLRPRASGPERRLRVPIDDRARVALPGTRAPRAAAAADLGRLSRAARLQGVTLTLAPSAGQEAELRALIAAQHDPSSAQYHGWLTPEAFGARFGAADEDVAQLQAWLRGHGLEVQGVARARNRIVVAGNVAQLEEAFGTELHALRLDGEAHFAPAGDVTVPAAVAPLIRTVAGLSSFRPRPRVRPTPRYASAQTGAHFLSPADVDVLYGVGPLRTSGLDGTGVQIDVVGQSAISPSDLEAFQRAAGLPLKDPVLSQVPNSGVATVLSGDEAESDLDLEWSSAMAPGATVRFVFTGSGSMNVWDSIQWAVDDDRAQIISVSYGMCEPGLPASGQAALDQILAQAAAQGQSVVVAAGDSGSVDCFDVPGLPTATQGSVAVDFPASSAYVTAVGGTEFTSDAAASSTYWTPAGDVDLLVSARSYVPEQAWNDGVAAHGAGGGGVSLRTPRPSWQAGVAGMPAGAERLVPDLSLAASPVRVPYLYCSNDQPAGSPVSGSCTDGFRDAGGSYLTTAGGTSFGAPVFAGMLALLEQGIGSRQGVVAPALYRIAADPARYAAAFHDVTVGGIQCAGSSRCGSLAASSYAAAPGYDLATGLGSIDLGKLLDAWQPAAPGFTAAGTDVAVAAGGTATSALTVVPVGGWSGTVSWTVTSTPALGAGCLSVPDTNVEAGKVALASVTIRASPDACAAASAGVLRPPGGAAGGGGVVLAALGALGLMVTAARPRRRWAAIAALAGAAALGLQACGGGGSGGGEGRAAVTYAVQVVGTDKASPAITSTASFTLTVN